MMKMKTQCRLLSFTAAWTNSDAYLPIVGAFSSWSTWALWLVCRYPLSYTAIYNAMQVLKPYHHSQHYPFQQLCYSISPKGSNQKGLAFAPKVHQPWVSLGPSWPSGLPSWTAFGRYQWLYKIFFFFLNQVLSFSCIEKKPKLFYYIVRFRARICGIGTSLILKWYYSI